MSGITSVQNPQEVNSINSTQDPQKSVSLHGRAFHKITDGGKYIIQSINRIAQSILSTCIYVVSFGRCDLDSLKSYFFSNQTALKDNETASFSSSPTAPPLPSNAPPPPPPPPPPMPTQGDLSRASSSSRYSNEEMRESTFQSFTAPADLCELPCIRSDVNFIQNTPQKDDNTLKDGANFESTLDSSLGENANRISRQEYSGFSDEEVESKKDKDSGFMITKEGIKNALKNLKKSKKKAAQG